jgi:hypothetical protein
MSTPLLAGEPQSLGYDPRDELLTIQGFVPEAITTSRKEPGQKLTQFSEISSQPASAQARFFLNAYWPNIQAGQADRIYNEWKIFKVIQKEANMPEDSANIPQALANLFLQRLKRTMTSEEFKTEFKTIDTNFDGKMSFLEYLVWDSKLGSPAAMTYRPQVQGAKLGGAIKKVLSCEKALRDNADTLAQKEAAVAAASGVKAKMAQNDLATFKENNDVARLNADLATAQNNLFKIRKPLVEQGTQFWEQRVEQELTGLKPQRLQK